MRPEGEASGWRGRALIFAAAGLVALAIEALARTPYAVPNPSLLVLPFALAAAYVGGAGFGLLVASLTVAYVGAYLFVHGEAPGSWGDFDAYRALVYALVAPPLTLLTARVRDRAVLLERERALRESAERQRDFVDRIVLRAPFAIAVVAGDADRVVLANPRMEALLGGRRLPPGTPLLAAAPGFAAPLASPQAGAGDEGGPTLVRLGTGAEERLVQVAVTPLPDADGRGRRLLLMAADVTEERRALEQLEHARAQLARQEKLAALGALVSGVAHEMRTPLTYAGSSLHILRRRLARAGADGAAGEDVGAEALLDDAEAGLDRLNRLVADLRGYAKMQRPEPGRVRFESAVAQALRIFRAGHEAGARVDADLAPVGEVAADAVQLQQVVLNLVENAADASPPGARVRVATRRVEDAAELVVEDEGPGVSEEARGRMFEPFFTTKASGTGLGLAIVRSIVETHRGSVAYEPRAPRGSRFVVRFALAGSSDEEAKAAVPTAP